MLMGPGIALTGEAMWDRNCIDYEKYELTLKTLLTAK
jgi:hypothetical protein